MKISVIAHCLRAFAGRFIARPAVLALAVSAMCQLPVFSGDDVRVPYCKSVGTGITALVLSGGGAKGLAHLAVLEEIERDNIKVDYVIGTSMGALIGGLYASGMSSADIRKAIEEVNIFSLFRPFADRNVPFLNGLGYKRSTRLYFDFEKGSGLVSRTGVIDDFYVMSLFNRLVCPNGFRRDFDELPVKFRAVAYDSKNKRRKVFDNGSLVEAMRASMGIPMVFQVFPIDGEEYVDGGLLDNVPVSVAVELGADCIITSDVSAENDNYSSSLSTFGVGAISQFSKDYYDNVDPVANSDVYIRHDVSRLGIFDFGKIDEIMSVGEEAIAPHRDELARIGAERPFCASAESGCSAAHIGGIRVEAKKNGGDHYASYLTRAVGKFAGAPLDEATLSKLSDTLERAKNEIGFDVLYFTVDLSGDIADVVVKYGMPTMFSHKISLMQNINFTVFDNSPEDLEKNFSFAFHPDIRLIYENYSSRDAKRCHSVSVFHENLYDLGVSYDFAYRPNLGPLFYVRPFASLSFGRFAVNDRDMGSFEFRNFDYRVFAGVDFYLDREKFDLAADAGVDMVFVNSPHSSATGRNVIVIPFLSFKVEFGNQGLPVIFKGSFVNLSFIAKAGLNVPTDGKSQLDFLYSARFRMDHCWNFTRGSCVGLVVSAGLDRFSPDLYSSYCSDYGMYGFPGKSMRVITSDWYYGEISFIQRFDIRSIGDPVLRVRVAVGQSDGASEHLRTSGEWSKDDALSVPFSNLSSFDLGVDVSAGFDTAFLSVVIGAGYKFFDDTWSIYVQM